jgi:hypothetical protein
VIEDKNASIAGRLLARPPRFPGWGIVERSIGVAVNVIGAFPFADAMGTTVADAVVVVDAFLGMSKPYR